MNQSSTALREGVPCSASTPGLPFGAWSEDAKADTFRDYGNWKKATAQAAALAALDSPLKKGYEKALGCQPGVRYDAAGRRRKAGPCRKRWCFNCRRAEWGRIYYGYLDPLFEAEQQAGGLSFVTLTTRACTGEDLEGRIARMKGDLSAARDATRRALGRFHWFQKIEVAKTQRGITLYRPHYHLIVAGERHAEEHVRQWLARHEFAEPAHQHVAAIGESAGTYDVGEDEPIEFYGLDGVLRYLAKGLIDPYGFEPEESDVVYCATRRTHITRSSDGLGDLAPRPEPWHEEHVGRLPADLGEVHFDPDGIIDLHTGEIFQAGDGA